MNRAATTATRRRLSNRSLRRELHECYQMDDRPWGRIEEIAAEIAELQEVENG